MNEPPKMNVPAENTVAAKAREIAVQCRNVLNRMEPDERARISRMRLTSLGMMNALVDCSMWGNRGAVDDMLRLKEFLLAYVPARAYTVPGNSVTQQGGKGPPGKAV